MIPYAHNSRKCKDIKNDKRFISHGLSTSAKGFVHVLTCTWIIWTNMWFIFGNDESTMHLDYTDKFNKWSTLINMLCTVKGADSCTKVMPQQNSSEGSHVGIKFILVLMKSSIVNSDLIISAYVDAWSFH